MKLLERITLARHAVLDRIEDGYSMPKNAEQAALREALTTLAEVRHGLIAKPAKSFRMSLGGRKVCTTF